MRAHPLVRAGALAYALCFWPLLAGAQWQAGVELTAISFGAASSDTSTASTGTVFRPGGGTAVGARLERRWSRLGLAVSVRRLHPAIVEETSELIVAAKNQMRFTEIAALLTVRLARLATGASLQVEAGPVVDIWEPQGLSERSEVGVATGLTLLFPLAGRLRGAVRAALAHSGSPFQSEDLPDRFVPHSMWRHSVAVGLVFRL